MANQNLSEFGEKLFVADADHTFIWDSTASISKRVSRNSWLNSGTLTSDAPVTISQTWGAVGQTFKALVVNAAGTSAANSASGSLLADFQTGGVSQFKVDKNGYISGVANITAFGANQLFVNNPLAVTGIFSIGSTTITDFIAELSASNKIVCNAGTQFGWGSQALSGGNGVALRASLDTILVRDGAPNTLALRNGAAAQTFNIYNTYQNAGVDFERIAFKWSANLFTIGREFGGTGIARNINITGGGSVLGIGSAANEAVSWTFSSNNFLAGTDNLYDIGASGASRPRNVYVGTSLFTGVGGINFDINARLRSPATDVITLYNNGLSDFNRLQFGGTTNLFPAIKRSSTTLQARLADDSAFAPIQGKLTTDTAFTATTVTPTGFITLYDSTGAAYKVPCVPA